MRDVRAHEVRVGQSRGWDVVEQRVTHRWIIIGVVVYKKSSVFILTFIVDDEVA